MLFGMKAFWGGGFALSRLLTISLAIALLSLAGCAEKPTVARPPRMNDPIRVGIIPTRAALPLSVADSLHYFEEEGVEIEIVSFQSNCEKDAAFSEGWIDIMFSDLVASHFLDASGVPISVVALVAEGNSKDGRLAIVVGPGSRIEGVQDLIGKELAIAPNCIIEFAAEKMLSEHGMSLEAVRRRHVTKLATRLARVMDDSLDAAILPEPLVTYAQTMGGRAIVDDRDRGYSTLVLSCRKEVSTHRTDQIERFLIAYNRAVADINQAPNHYRRELIELSCLPSELEEIVCVSRYAHWSVPPRIAVDESIAWLKQRHPHHSFSSYEEIVNQRFVRREEERCAKVWQRQQQAHGRVAAN